MEHEDLRRWIEGYERAWRTAGTDLLEGLFAADASYLAAPFEPPIHGRAAIADFWEAERESAEEIFALTWEPVAVERDVGVARVQVRYSGPPPREYRDLWIVTLDADRQCIAFEEWPFFPDQLRVSSSLDRGRPREANSSSPGDDLARTDRSTCG